MTTIIFNAETQEIACDSRMTAGGIIISDQHDKMFEHGNDMWFLAGTCADMELLMDSQLHEQIPFALECAAFVIRPDGFYTVYTNKENRVCQLPLQYTEGLGSGGDFALAGIDLGLTTREAVAYACTRDCASGGTIHVYNKDGIIDPDNSIEQEADDAN